MLFGGALPNNSFGGGFGNKLPSEAPNFGLYAFSLVEGGTLNVAYTFVRAHSLEKRAKLPTFATQIKRRTCNLTFFKRRIKAVRVERGNRKVKR